MSNEIDAELIALCPAEIVSAIYGYGSALMSLYYAGPDKDKLVTLIGALVRERDSALAFAGSVLKEARDHIGTDISGGDVQDWAARDGLLEKVIVTESCGEECVCEGYFPTDCYRFTALGNRALEAAKKAADE